MAEISENARSAVTERVRELVKVLRAAPAIERFRTAEQRFRTDAELGRMQAAVRSTHEQLQKAQSENRHDPRLFQQMRDAQADLQRHPLVVEFLAARQEAEGLLRETNLAMAEVLGLDIGASVGRAGGC